VKLVDLNVLLYATNEDSPQHAVAISWWENALNGDESVALSWVVLLGFLRIATNPRIFPSPLALDAALARIDVWLALDNVHIVREKDEHWEVLRELLAASGMAGNLTTDAHLAVLAICHDATLVTFDADFARFKGLRREIPAGKGGT
jgi:hypothetical protein